MTVVSISAEDLKRRMDEGGCTVVNVLSKDMYDDCHIAGSRNVPVSELETAASGWNKEQEIVVYCAHLKCDASKRAFNALKGMGFKNVAAFEGGMKEWHQKGLPSEGACVADYLK